MKKLSKTQRKLVDEDEVIIKIKASYFKMILKEDGPNAVWVDMALNKLEQDYKKRVKELTKRKRVIKTPV